MKFLILLLFVLIFQRGLTIQYKELSYQEIVDRFEQFEKKYSKVFKLIQNFDDTEEDLPQVKCGRDDCKFFYGQITKNHTINDKPAILLVGGFHGNERVGQNVITELTELILENQERSPFKEFLEDRIILLMPMVNPSGYYFNIREEKQSREIIDVNRDFSYDVDFQKKCFQSKAARAIANIYKKYVILTGLTFHGGDNVVSWPWGSYNHLINSTKSQNSPDNTILNRVGQIMVDLALANTKFQIDRYRQGSMTDTVYPCNGAYEDWAYGAGWETNIVEKQCVNVPQSFYQGLRGSPRNLIYLVEADDRKEPPNLTYGTSEVVDKLLEQWPPKTFNKQSLIDETPLYEKNYGHIARNILLSLALVDLAQPYLIKEVDGFRVGGCSEVSQIQIINSQGKIVRDDQNKPGIWKNASHVFNIEQHLQNHTNKKFYVNISCDNEDRKQTSPEPKLSPQSYLMQLRNNDSFVAQVGNHTIQPKQYFLFQFKEDEFKLVTQIQFEISENENLDSSATEVQAKPLIQEYIYIILVFMVLIATLLSYVFYKYCNELPYEEGVDIQMVSSSHVEVHQDDKNYEVSA